MFTTIKAGKTKVLKVYKCSMTKYTGIQHARFNNRRIHADNLQQAKKRYFNWFGSYPDSTERI